MHGCVSGFCAVSLIYFSDTWPISHCFNCKISLKTLIFGTSKCLSFFSLKLCRLFLAFYPSIWMTRITFQVPYTNIHTHTIYYNFYWNYFELTDKHWLFPSMNMLFSHIFRTCLCPWINFIIFSMKILPRVAKNIPSFLAIMIRVILKFHYISNWLFLEYWKLLILKYWFESRKFAEPS